MTTLHALAFLSNTLLADRQQQMQNDTRYVSHVCCKCPSLHSQKMLKVAKKRCSNRSWGMCGKQCGYLRAILHKLQVYRRGETQELSPCDQVQPARTDLPCERSWNCIAKARLGQQVFVIGVKSSSAGSFAARPKFCLAGRLHVIAANKVAARLRGCAGQ